ncbi:hypothetical protein U9M48_005576 [Paspalum notatum var. saurae]|uniref:DUF8040 domain-containing protein n=1 Tax=Paspalum notatum var. saurae TaxID=547442 RepID=A0AAQ3PXV7_PASNO
MEPEIFRSLANYLRREGFVRDTRIKVEEKLAFFLYMLSHNASFEDLQEKFGSPRKIWAHMKHFSNLVIPKLSKQFLKLPNPNQIRLKIERDSRFFPYFKNCIGAIDGTHIPISISSDKAAPFRNRKGTLSQNIMIACMIVAEPAVWANIIELHPNAKRFRNKSFPLFEALGELHDGHIAEGTYNFTSTQLHNPPKVIQDESDDETERVDVMPINLEEIDEETTNEDEEPRTSATVIRNKEPTNEDEGSSLTRRAAAVSRNKEPKESKRQRKSSNIEAIMERYVDIRAKQIKSETTQSTKEKEDVQANDFAIKRCISILNTMDVTKEEKVKAYSVFKNTDSRKNFLSASDEDPESAMIWLRNEMISGETGNSHREIVDGLTFFERDVLELFEKLLRVHFLYTGHTHAHNLQCLPPSYASLAAVFFGTAPTPP